MHPKYQKNRITFTSKFPGAFSLLFSALVQIFDHPFAAVAIFVIWITRMSSSQRIGMIMNVIFFLLYVFLKVETKEDR